MYISPILGSQHLLSFQLRDCKVSISLSHPATNHSRWAILGDFTGLPKISPGHHWAIYVIRWPQIFSSPVNQPETSQVPLPSLSPGYTTGQLPVDSLMLPSQCSAFRRVSRFCPWKDGVRLPMEICSKKVTEKRVMFGVWICMNMSYMLLHVE